MREEVERLLREAKRLPEGDRIALYNAVSKANGRLVSDVSDDPALSIQLVPCNRVKANEYNPNHVADTEMDLLEQSICEDGVTMPVVTIPDKSSHMWYVVDGFHRHVTISQRLGRKWIPVSEVDKDQRERMASTIRHNRARGKHQVDLMAAIVKTLLQLEWSNQDIAKQLGMTEEEMLRLCQMEGCAEMLASNEYGRSWGPIDGK